VRGDQPAGEVPGCRNRTLRATWRWGFAGFRIEISLEEGKGPARVEAAGDPTRGRGDRRVGARPGCVADGDNDMRR
jgi:hypothetical protein